jgi:hypothetical protein
MDDGVQGTLEGSIEKEGFSCKKEIGVDKSEGEHYSKFTGVVASPRLSRYERTLRRHRATASTEGHA